jgi:arylsulfatase A-like enzyme
MAAFPLVGIGPLRPALAQSRDSRSVGRGDAPNILVLVFDALSARHISLYGYRRNTMPNLARFAERATVFHSHYAGGNFTTPGTASLLTGAYPWSHRAVNMQGTVVDGFRQKTIFNLLGEKGYFRVGFSHNILAVSLLNQFRADLDHLEETRKLCLVDDYISERLFEKDFTPAIHAENLFSRGGDSYSNSLFLYWIFRLWYRHERNGLHKRFELFPRGIPGSHNLVFLLEDAINWTMRQLQEMPSPFFAYLHFLPPHDPYDTRRDFIDRFDDGWQPKPKPLHPLTANVPTALLNRYRREYDEYIAYVDAEFGRLYDFMREKRLLNNTYVFVTSDHGELFERGVWEHITPLLFEPVIRVPLLISRPDQQTREDVRTPTSCVDILPTLARIAGLERPDWTEGEPLPAIVNTKPRRERSIYCVEAKQSAKHGPLKKRTVSLIREGYKLIHYLGYEGYDDVYELYDLTKDPEELRDIYRAKKSVAAELRALLSEHVATIGGGLEMPRTRH